MSKGEKTCLLAWHRSVIFSRTKEMVATLRFDMICQLMAINKALVIDPRELGYLQVVLLYGCREGKEKEEITANKTLNKMVKQLKHREQGKCEVGWRQGGKKWVHTYIFPVASHPTVMCAFCSLTRPDDGRTLVSITKILSDPSGALQSAVNISVLNADPTGYRALAKQTQNTWMWTHSTWKDVVPPDGDI